MPAKNPRLTITIPSELNDSIADLAELRGVSRASIAVEFLESAQPVIERVVTVLRALKSAEQSTVDEYVSNLEDAERTLAPLLAAAVGKLDLPQGVLPPSCNTGVTPSAEGSNKPRSEPPKPNNGAASSQVEGEISGADDNGGYSHDV